MLIVMGRKATARDVQKVKKAVKAMGLRSVAIPGAERTAIGVVGNQGWVDDSAIKGLKGVQEVIHVTKPYKLISRDFHPRDTTVRLGKGVSVGGRSPLLIIAGPCAVESRAQIMKTAKFLKGVGVSVLRGGAFKPRTSPHSFQGMRLEGLKILDEARKKYGLLVVTEVTSPEHVGVVSEHVDVLQVGARNMQNYDLLREIGGTKKPVVLKRGLSATMKEWLASAEYIALEGNSNIILCERGIRTFETETRNTADLSIIPLVRAISHLPVIFDPSHATGHRSLVGPMSMASVVVGAHGVMIEVHPSPETALSDGPQSLKFKQFQELLGKLSILQATMSKLG